MTWLVNRVCCFSINRVRLPPLITITTRAGEAEVRFIRAASRYFWNDVLNLQWHPDIAQRYYKGVLWSPSYFAASCGGAPVWIIRQYIEEQRKNL